MVGCMALCEGWMDGAGTSAGTGGWGSEGQSTERFAVNFQFLIAI